MRPFYLAAILGAGSLGVLGLTPGSGEAHGQRQRGGRCGPVVVTSCAPGTVGHYPATGYFYPPAPMYRLLPSPSYPPAGPAAPSRPTTTVTVAANDNAFEPRTVTVLPGTAVRWVNNGRNVHTVTANDGQWDSGDLA